MMERPNEPMEDERLIEAGLEEVRRILRILREVRDLNDLVGSILKGEDRAGSGKPIINMYPGKPAGCFPVNLVLLPAKRMDSYSYVLGACEHILGWLKRCDNFSHRHLVVLSDHYPVIFIPPFGPYYWVNWEWWDEWWWHWPYRWCVRELRHRGPYAVERWFKRLRSGRLSVHRILFALGDTALLYGDGGLVP